MSAPPRLAARLVAWALPARLRSAVLHDLDALFADRSRRSGRHAARRWYWGQARRTLPHAFRNVGGNASPPLKAPRRSGMADNLIQDARFGLRLMARRPAVTAAAVLAIALGVGANLSVFTIINGTLFSPPPGVQRPHELVAVYHSWNGTPMLIQYPRFRAYRDEARDAFIDLAAYRRLPLHLRFGGERLRVQGALASGGYFSTLGLEPYRGRLFDDDDDRLPGAHPVAVISHGLWQRLGGGEMVGAEVGINGHLFEIVGVAAPGFRGIEVGDTTDVWLPAAMQRIAMAVDTDYLNSPQSAWSATFGRLRPGVDLAAARERLSRLAAAHQQEQEVFNGSEVLLFDTLWVSPYARDDLVDLGRMLAVVVAAVLALACANVANLMLAEAFNRRGELLMRRTLGATSGRLLRQLFMEAMLLSSCGAALGTAIAAVATPLFASLRVNAEVALADTNQSIDHRVLLATLALTLVAGMTLALAPALHLTSSRRSLRPIQPGIGMRGRSGRLRSSLVLAQVALSFSLLVGAGLLVRTLIGLHRVDPGFRVEGLDTFVVDFELEGYDEERGRALVEEIRGSVAAVPGVSSVSAGNLVPFTLAGMQRNSASSYVFLDDNRVPEGLERISGPDGRILLGTGSVAPDYFTTVGIPLIDGRSFDARDDRTGPPALIVSRATAEAFWPGERAVGRSLHLGSRDGEAAEVVGVVGDQSLDSLAEPGWRYLIFRPLAQKYTPDLNFVVRGASADVDLHALRRAVASVDASLVVYGLETMADRVQRSLAQQVLLARLTATFGVLALILSSIGLYGVLARVVNERIPELGVRVALGARSPDLLRMILGYGLRRVGAGLLLGLPATWALTRLFDSVLFGVDRLDPLSLGAAAAVMTVVGVVACAVPARRAARVDAMVSLRRA